MSGGIERSEQAGADPRAALARALAELEGLAKRKRRPTRYCARELLLPLGELALAEGPDATRDAVKRLARAVEPFREEWEQAVSEELALACAEHVMGVDPRHLGHPRFDFTYVVAARERLEARLAAAELLDLSPPESTLDRVAAADRLLEPHLRSGGRRPD